MSEEPPEEFKKLDEKTLLAQQAAMLNGIYNQLVALNQKLGEPDENGAETVYRCTKCHSTILEDERQKHARKEHNSPPNMSVEELGLFEEA